MVRAAKISKMHDWRFLSSKENKRLLRSNLIPVYNRFNEDHKRTVCIALNECSTPYVDTKIYNYGLIPFLNSYSVMITCYRLFSRKEIIDKYINVHPTLRKDSKYIVETIVDGIGKRKVDLNRL